MDKYRGSVADWLDDYIEQILINKTIDFNFIHEKKVFETLFTALNSGLGNGAFVKYRDGRAIGGLAPAYFEAVTIGVYRSIDCFKKFDKVEAVQVLASVVAGKDFREVTGPGGNTLPKLRSRIRVIQEAYENGKEFL